MRDPMRNPEIFRLAAALLGVEIADVALKTDNVVRLVCQARIMLVEYCRCAINDSGFGVGLADLSNSRSVEGNDGDRQQDQR